MHSWMLYLPQAPVLDLHFSRVTSVLDLHTAFHSLHLCPEKNQCLNGSKRVKQTKSPNKTLPDSDTSEEEIIDPRYVTSVGGRQYSTIKGSAVATKIALSHSHAQTNLRLPKWKI